MIAAAPTTENQASETIKSLPVRISDVVKPWAERCAEPSSTGRGLRELDVRTTGFRHIADEGLAA